MHVWQLLVAVYITFGQQCSGNGRWLFYNGCVCFFYVCPLVGGSCGLAGFAYIDCRLLRQYFWLRKPHHTLISCCVCTVSVGIHAAG
jgi:hypothetical protein